MTTELTPAEKRKQTLERNYGKDWRKTVGQLAKEARVLKNGEEGYEAQQSNAGKRGGVKLHSSTRPFKANRKLASQAGKKRAGKMWPKDDKQNSD